MQHILVHNKAKEVYPSKRGVIARVFMVEGKWQARVTCWPEEEQRLYTPIVLVETSLCTSRKKALEKLLYILEKK